MRASLCAAAVLVMGSACNAILGIEAGNLVEDGDASAGGDATSSGGASSSAGGGASGGGGGSSGAAAGGAMSTGGSSGSGGGGGGVAGTGGGGMAGAGGTPPKMDGGIGGSQAELIRCGDGECNASAEVCCAGFGLDAHCNDAAIACSTPITAHCDGPEDCPGEFCCGSPSGGLQQITIACEPTCNPLGGEERTIECLGARNCPANQYCCSASAAATRCSPSCSSTVCQSGDDCPPGQTCREESGVPLGVCQPDPVGTVRCGSEDCLLSDGVECCFGAGGPTCVPRVDCGSQDHFSCDGKEDCAASATSCCYVTDFATTHSECAGDCASIASLGPSVVLDCSGPHNCPPGEVCCLSMAPGTGYRASCRAADSCSDPSSEQVVCSANQDCPRSVGCSPFTLAGVPQSNFLKVCSSP